MKGVTSPALNVTEIVEIDDAVLHEKIIGLVFGSLLGLLANFVVVLIVLKNLSDKLCGTVWSESPLLKRLPVVGVAVQEGILIPEAAEKAHCDQCVIVLLLNRFEPVDVGKSLANDIGNNKAFPFDDDAFIELRV